MKNARQMVIADLIRIEDLSIKRELMDALIMIINLAVMQMKWEHASDSAIRTVFL